MDSLQQPLSPLLPRLPPQRLPVPVFDLAPGPPWFTSLDGTKPTSLATVDLNPVPTTIGNLDTTGNYYEGKWCPYPLDTPINFDLRNGWIFGGVAGVYSGPLGGTRFEIEGFST